MKGTYCSVFVVCLYLCIIVLATASSDEDDYEDDLNLSELNSTSINGTLVFTKELKNITDESPSKTVKFECEVQNNSENNTKVTFFWAHNHAILENGQRIMIKRMRDKDKEGKFKSVLKIHQPELFDKGIYECIANNGLEKIKSSAYLHVSQEFSKFESTIENTIKFDNTNPEPIFPEATTVPNKIHKYKGEFTLPDVPETELNEKTTTINNNNNKQSNNNNPTTFDLSPSGKILAPHIPVYNSSEPFCQLYKGKRCKRYLDNQFVFIQPPYTQEMIEGKLNGAFVVISQSNDISSSCNKFATPSLCYSAFPLCLDPTQINTYQKDYVAKHKGLHAKDKKLKNLRNDLNNSLRRICRDDCILLETELCSKEYAIAKRHPVIGKTLELEECEYLPDNSKNCLSLGVDIENSINKEDTCYWDDGESYRGIQDVSLTKEECIRWSHQFHILPSEYPEISGHNYCRNPGGKENEPFCYVDQNRKELCGIKKCAYVMTMYVSTIFFACLMAVVIIAVICCKRKSRKARNIQNMNTPTASKNIYGNPGPNSPMELNTLLPMNIPPNPRSHVSKGNYQNVPQYTYRELNFVEELGEGAFGKVYKGELKTKNGKTFVAVKSLKENASAKTQADFQREIELISELKHPNIICIMGVVTKQEPVCMLFEYMSEGDLHEFLIANSPGEGKCLTQNQFLHIAIQIAQGMEYLSDNHYVHRDLAARNCLVSADLVVKISDFGLSRDMYSCDYYRVQSKSLLPVRWMPPESILYGKFTTESDVWSYGVVLWEIYSYGLQPYYGYNNQEVINMIRSRKLLPCPDACPSYCYSLMVECWAELAVRRPSFGEISHRLRVWKQNGSSNGAYFKTPENYPHPQRCGHSSKSSHTDSQTLCPTLDGTPGAPTLTWERASSNKLHESQSSLTSRSSSIGNKTQSTSLSNEPRSSSGRKSSTAERRSHNHHHHHRSARSEENTLERPEKMNNSCCNSNPKNMVIVSSNGDNYETKITL